MDSSLIVVILLLALVVGEVAVTLRIRRRGK